MGRQARGLPACLASHNLRGPARLRAFGLETEMLRDGRKAKTMQMRLMDGEVRLTMATLSDRNGAFAEILQAMTFERRAAQAQAS